VAELADALDSKADATPCGQSATRNSCDQKRLGNTRRDVDNVNVVPIEGACPLGATIVARPCELFDLIVVMSKNDGKPLEKLVAVAKSGSDLAISTSAGKFPELF
jgi:hypothetical protein